MTINELLKAVSGDTDYNLNIIMEDEEGSYAAPLRIGDIDTDQNYKNIYLVQDFN